MNALIATSPTVTMTSLEMVEYINVERKAAEGDDAKTLAHADFMKKVPSVLGEGHGNFSDTYTHPQNAQKYPMYRFPKREACLMAMSYSYDLQAKVFDRMTALEKPVAMTAAQMLLAQAQALVDMESRQIATENVVKQLQANQHQENDYFSAMGFARLQGFTISNSDANKIGRKAAKLSRERGLPIGDVRDPRYGTVHTYHESVLDDVINGLDG